MLGLVDNEDCAVPLEDTPKNLSRDTLNYKGIFEITKYIAADIRAFQSKSSNRRVGYNVRCSSFVLQDPMLILESSCCCLDHSSKPSIA
jgi:hypothetical protein